MSAQKLRLSDDLTLPRDAVTRTFGIFGQRGSGKSTTGAVLVEQAVKVGGRGVVLDPTGVWYGLTREGTAPGIAGVVLGGEHGDAPLEPQAGALVAEFTMSSDYPLVVLDLKLLRKHQRQHFAMEFLEALYHDNRDPLLVVFDEAAQFAPQQMREGGDVPRLLGAVEDLVKLGRSRGLGAVMIEQRIATLNANVREQIETLISHRLIGPLDRKALREWIAAQGEPEREAEALALIPKLKPPSALVWSPSFLRFFGQVAIHNATTFDSRATPEVGKRRRALTARAPVDLQALRERMAATIAKAEAENPKAMRKRIAELERELAAKPVPPAPPAPQLERIEVPAIAREDIEQLGDVAAAITQAVLSLHGELERLGAAGDSIRQGLERVVAAQRGPVAPVARPAPPRRVERPKAASASHAPRASPNGSAVPPARQRVLDALAALEALGVRPADRAQLAFFAGKSPSSSGYANDLGALRSEGLLTYPTGGSVELTEAGRAVASAEDAPGTEAELHERLRALLQPARWRIVEALIKVGRPLSREDLAEKVGASPTSSGFANNLGGLRTLGLIDYPSSGLVEATEIVFLR